FAAVFITHPHIDHTRGLPFVMKDFTVSHLITNGRPRGVDGAVLESGGEQQENAEREAARRGALRTILRSEVESGVGLTDAHIDPARGLPFVMKDFTVSHLITNGRPRGVDGAVLESGGEQQENAEREAARRGALRTILRSEVESGVGLTDAHIDPVACESIDP